MKVVNPSQVICGLVSFGRHWCQAMKVSTAAVTQVPKAAKGHGLDGLIFLRFQKIEGQCGISICDRTTSRGGFVLSHSALFWSFKLSKPRISA